MDNASVPSSTLLHTSLVASDIRSIRLNLLTDTHFLCDSFIRIQLFAQLAFLFAAGFLLHALHLHFQARRGHKC